MIVNNNREGLTTPHTLISRGASDILTTLCQTPNLTSTATVTNPLDEQQQQILDQEEGAKHRSMTKARLQGKRQIVSKYDL